MGNISHTDKNIMYWEQCKWRHTWRKTKEQRYLISLHHKMNEQERWHVKWEYLREFLAKNHILSNINWGVQMKEWMVGWGQFIQILEYEGRYLNFICYITVSENRGRVCNQRRHGWSWTVCHSFPESLCDFMYRHGVLHNIKAWLKYIGKAQG